LMPSTGWRKRNSLLDGETSSTFLFLRSTPRAPMACMRQ
jgi:hypothetical protein